MGNFKEALVATMLPAIKAVGKAELEEVLSEIKSRNSFEIFQATLKGINSNFSLLQQVAYKTKTRIDDGIIDLVLEAVRECADAEGIVLSN